MLFVRLLFESFRFAVNELRVNLMRTILSLLGVTIGIFSLKTTTHGGTIIKGPWPALRNTSFYKKT
jgi:hypothetical protein